MHYPAQNYTSPNQCGAYGVQWKHYWLLREQLLMSSEQSTNQRYEYSRVREIEAFYHDGRSCKKRSFELLKEEDCLEV
jgi:hypothetical protein